MAKKEMTPKRNAAKCYIQVSPVTTRRLGSTNLTRNGRQTHTYKMKHEQLYLSQCGWGMFGFRSGSEFI